MDLILWRHCDAAPGVPDGERPLTPRGARQAARMGAWLARRLPASCRILVSPALRAEQTARALHRPYISVDAIGPGASVAALLDAAGWPRAMEPALVVAHQPTLGRVASLLLERAESDRAMGEGVVWWLTSDSASTDPGVVLKFNLGPDSI